jgi:ribosomal-protein-alanine N-acetyltransferase
MPDRHPVHRLLLSATVSVVGSGALGHRHLALEKFPRWEIVQFLSGVIPWLYPDDGALSFIRDIAFPAMARGTAWHWSIRPKATADELIGVITLMEGPEDKRGFWIASEWQDCGFATEAANVVTDFWFETLGKLVLRVPKAIVNTSSRRISVTSGMRVVASGERNYVSGRLPAETWEITRKEWRWQSRP